MLLHTTYNIICADLKKPSVNRVLPSRDHRVSVFAKSVIIHSWGLWLQVYMIIGLPHRMALNLGKVMYALHVT